MSEPALDPPEATQAAVAAATAADAVIHELHSPREFAAAQRLFEEIWRPAEGNPPPITAELLRALAHAGNYVAGAFAGGVRPEGSGEPQRGVPVNREGSGGPRRGSGVQLVGASAGFFTAPPDPGLHSHITGVAPAGQHHGIGFALKVHQRAWALARGIRVVAWTFDPLVARNAWFNLTKLGARPTAYLEDFYGPMTDAINAGMASDRLLLAWELDDPAVAAACAGRPRPPPPVPAEAALTVGPDLEPLARRPDTAAVTVAVPPQLEALDPEQRRAWRQAVREALGRRLADGATVTGFLRHPDRYLVEPAKAGTDRVERPGPEGPGIEPTPPGGPGAQPSPPGGRP